MSDHHYPQSILSLPGRSRRRFLVRTAFATAGASAATMLCADERTETLVTQRATPPKCPAVNVPMKDVAGKVAFITGGSSGIGLGMARAFVNAGMKVAFTYRNPSQLNEAMQYFADSQGRVHAINLDVTDRPGMERAATDVIKAFGKVHVLVNNAGVALAPAVSATSYQDWDWTLNTNLNGPFNGVHTFLPLIRSHGEGGHIITTSSAMGLFATSAAGAYTVSKYAVIGLMEALRAELADTDIGTSVFCPGLVDSHITENSLRTHPGEGTPASDSKTIEEDRKLRANREFSMDPLEAGQIVLRGMRNNDLYIFSHPEFEQIIRDRSEALLASIPRDLHPPQARVEGIHEWLGTSIYTAERDRRLCTTTESAKSKM